MVEPDNFMWKYGGILMYLSLLLTLFVVAKVLVLWIEKWRSKKVSNGEEFSTHQATKKKDWFYVDWLAFQLETIFWWIVFIGLILITFIHYTE